MSSDEKRLYLHVSGDEEEEEESSENEETSDEEEDGEVDEIVYTATTQPEDRAYKEKTMAMEINRLRSENALLQTRLVAVETERDGLQVDLNQLGEDYSKLKDIIKRLSPDEFAKVEEDEAKCDISSCEEDESLLLTCVSLDVDEKTPTPPRVVPPSNIKTRSIRSMMDRVKRRQNRIKKKDADYVYLDPKKTKRVRDNNVEVEQKSKRVTVEKEDTKGEAKGKEKSKQQKDITKGKSKGKVKLDILADVAAVDVDIDSDFEHDEDRQVEKVKLRKTDTYMILVSDGMIDHVEAHIAARGHIARSLIWQQDDNNWVLCVNLRQIERLINEDFTDATVLNAYISMLQRDHDERNAEIGNPPFTIYCLDTYVSSYMKQNLEGSKNDHIIAPIMARPLPTFLVFPLHHGEGAGIGHWTVVVCETRTKIWTHYDSMAPRHTYSTRYNFARKLMGYVDSNVQMVDQSVTQPTIIQNKDCPQQDAGSLDCGLFVLNVIRSYFMKGLMEPSEDNSFVRRLRADIVKKFLRIDDKVSKVDVAAPSQPNFNLLSQDTLDNVAPPSQPNFNLLSQDPLV